MAGAVEEERRRLFGVAEAAVMLGVTESAVYQAARQNRLPARRWGRKICFLADELEQFLAELPRQETKQPLRRRTLVDA